jgi:hypothetical protein
MAKDILRYDKMVEAALRGVVREALVHTAKHGLPGAHHFYITFRTRAPGVAVPDYLLAKYPEEMTIVLEHQFWDLEVTDDGFGVTLSFHNRPEHLVVPFAAVSAFADPSVKFGLQFQEVPGEAAVPKGEAPGGAVALRNAGPPVPVEKPAEAKPEIGEKAAEKKPGEVVTLDSFRKK